MEPGLSPKGEFDAGEEPLCAAKQEFREETGLVAKSEYQPLKPLRQRGGKIVNAWAVQCDVDAAAAKSNAFSMEWPRGSGKIREFPGIDRAEWFKIDSAKRKILKSQLGLLGQLEQAVGSRRRAVRSVGSLVTTVMTTRDVHHSFPGFSWVTREASEDGACNGREFPRPNGLTNPRVQRFPLVAF